MSSPIIVALDFNNSSSAFEFLDKIQNQPCRVKIGKELFTRSGPRMVEQVVQRGFDVFLDLKFHDIPNTVAGAVAAAADLGVWMLNVHASGGLAMMEQAQAALGSAGDKRPLLVAVTVLTSLAAADLSQLGIADDPQQQVLRLARLARDAGLDGVVCSAAETVALRSELGGDFCLVTPGIRRQQDASGDQKRVVGPRQAIADGSNYLVVGRPITQADDPVAALQEFHSAITGVS
ncbi:MAG: orotidine-5'-phosphate decarboxylase [Gammaproteobacteria bacterium]